MNSVKDPQWAELIHSFIQKIFIEQLLCPKQLVRPRGLSKKEGRHSGCPPGARIHVEGSLNQTGSSSNTGARWGRKYGGSAHFVKHMVS